MPPAETYAERLSRVVPAAFELRIKDSHVKIKGKSAIVSAKYVLKAENIRGILNGSNWANPNSVFWSSRGSIHEVFFFTFV
jgi:hypothetical protein